MHNDEENNCCDDHFNLVLDESDRLLPCPFCGGTNLELANTWTASYWIECQDCEAQISGVAYEPNESREAHELSAASAIVKWNTRAVVGVVAEAARA